MSIEELLTDCPDTKEKDYRISQFREWSSSVGNNYSRVVLEYGLIRHENFLDFVRLVKDSMIESGCEVLRYEVNRVYPYISGISGISGRSGSNYSWKVRILGRFCSGMVDSEGKKVNRVALKLEIKKSIWGERESRDKIYRGVMVAVPKNYRHWHRES